MHFSDVTRLCQHFDVQERDFISHCSTEAEIIALDTGVRMDGLSGIS